MDAEVVTFEIRSDDYSKVQYRYTIKYSFNMVRLGAGGGGGKVEWVSCIE